MGDIGHAGGGMRGGDGDDDDGGGGVEEVAGDWRWGLLWRYQCLCILEEAVASGCNAVSGGPSAEGGGSVAPKKECV